MPNCIHCGTEFVFWKIVRCDPQCKLDDTHRYCPNCNRLVVTIKEIEGLLEGIR